MFCPECAAKNIEGAGFCRVCGVNISLVPQALTGRLPQAETAPIRGRRGVSKRRNREKEPPSLEKGIVCIFAGLGFIVAAFAVMAKFPGGVFWGWTLFIPAFGNLGKGIAAIAEYQRYQGSVGEPPEVADPGVLPPARNVTQPFLPTAPARTTGELMPQPPSVTEGTTRHLGAEAPTRHLDSTSE